MGTYKQCVNCGNTHSGDTIQKCGSCGQIFCDSCKNGGNFSTKCPRCNTNYILYVGEISSDSNNKNNTGCFITSATLNSTQQADDGVILTAFRNFRDNWLLKQENGKSIIQDYYSFAPEIVENIEKKDDAKNIYNSIYNDYLSLCYTFIKQNKFKEAFEKYKEMVFQLKSQYL